ncbi:MAG TPA: tetratricopeptide repeat protein, partial [Candidatus Polarisedimenticolaceae bacterium]|nr:tetratricopeptide repeat protein [Candidatus Polarisedimenticolaceae bacterium]
EATLLASRALESSRLHSQRNREALALYVLGEIAQVGTPMDFAKAEENYQRAVALAEELRMRPLLAHCYCGLGKLYRGTGDNDKAKLHLTNAIAMMRHMEMGLWLDRARAELQGLV